MPPSFGGCIGTDFRLRVVAGGGNNLEEIPMEVIKEWVKEFKDWVMGVRKRMSEAFNSVTEAPKDAANAAEARKTEVRDGSINKGANPSSIEMDPSKDGATNASGDNSGSASADATRASGDSRRARPSDP
jgi:hypothetical protein